MTRREVLAAIDVSPVYKPSDFPSRLHGRYRHSPNGLALCTVIAGRASAPTLIWVVALHGRSADGKALSSVML